jgi:2-amino-4-hydroxy-6-hydroxymethyldihydropteridine diphosphokinase
LSESVFLGLGSNLGDRLGNLQSAIQRLRSLVELTSVSSLYETEPVGVTEQPAFYNAACSGTTGLDPEALLDFVKGIEWDLGRRPGPIWGPRQIDIDILIYGEQQVDSPRLHIPHERLAERAFVLCPLAELQPDLAVPGLGSQVRELLQDLDTSGVRLVAGPGWEQQGLDCP